MAPLHRAETGLSIRLIRQYDAELGHAAQPTMHDVALMLAMGDDREDVPISRKLADAMAFLKSRIH